MQDKTPDVLNSLKIMRSNQQQNQEKMLTFKSGGWVLLLALIMMTLVFAWGMSGILVKGKKKLGDGNNIDSYGFDLSNLIVDREVVAAGTVTRDLIPSLTNPRIIQGTEVENINKEVRGKYLVPDDIVVGLVINAQARAYPIRILDVHEIINDTFESVAVAVTYSPWCNSISVFDRQVDGEMLEFGVSGLLYNENLLMYDRRPEEKRESLWSQIQARAISGHATTDNKTLNRITYELTTWQEWLEKYPQTQVLDNNPMPSLGKRYSRRTYGAYFSTGAIRKSAKVSPLPPDDDRAVLDKIIIVEVNNKYHAFAVNDILQKASQTGVCTVTVDGKELRFQLGNLLNTISVTNKAGESVVIAHSFWFAWYAMHPDVVIE